MPFYPRKLKHDFLIDGGLEVTGNSTVAGNATITGTLTQTGVATFTVSPVFSAGVTIAAQKAAVTMSTGGYVVPHVQSLTGANCYTTKRTGTAIVPYGVTQIKLTKAESSDAAAFKYNLLKSPAPGVEKIIHVQKTTGGSTQVCYVLTSATAVTLYRSTCNAFLFTTDLKSSGAGVLHLVGTTGGLWDVLSINYSSLVTRVGVKLENT